MEDIEEEEEEEPILDIDRYDANNSLAAVEYVSDLYEFYRKTEVRFSLVFKIVSEPKPLDFEFCLRQFSMDFGNLQRFSCVPLDYMAQQFDITDKMRAILIDWLIEVYSKISQW